MAMADGGNPVQPKRLCWSYARTSTTRQAREDRSGMERQQQALAAWLADHAEFQL
jgi:DNA invertase Pin-like site-specific DNA recombinase